MSETINPKLKPCPFCGRRDVDITLRLETAWWEKAFVYAVVLELVFIIWAFLRIIWTAVAR